MTKGVTTGRGREEAFVGREAVREQKGWQLEEEGEEIVRGKSCGAERGAGRQLEREIRRMDSACWCACALRSLLAFSLWLAGFQLRLSSDISWPALPLSFRPFLSGCLSLSRFHHMDSPQDTPSTDHHDDQQAKSSYVPAYTSVSTPPHQPSPSTP